MAKVIHYLKNEWPFFLIALIGLVLKCIDLGERPLHHDESLHAQYGRYFANSFTTGFYKYDPLLHGPLLYHLQGLWHKIAAPLNNAGVRFIPVVLGFLLSLAPLAFRSKLPKTSLLFISAFFALSPTFTYWSRFLRHDFIVLFSLCIGLWAWVMRPKLWGLFLGIAAGIHFSSKENFFVHLALLFGFWLTELIITGKRRFPELKSSLQFFGGFLLISVPLYTAWFQYPQGFLDGLYRKSLFYWLDQHHSERIKGPFFYKTLIVSIYETWILPVIMLFAFHWLKRSQKNARLVDLGALAVFTLLAFICPMPVPGFISTWFKVKNQLDLFIFLLYIYAALRGTIFLLKHEKIELAFFFYLFTASLFTYSYLGEKVPWLAIYPTIAFVLLSATTMPSLRRSHICAVFALFLVCFPKTIYINYISAGAANELISQVHTASEYEIAAKKIQSALETPPGHVKPRVLILDDNGWPLSWYLWGRSGVEYTRHPQNYTQYDFIFDKLFNPELNEKLSESHRRVVLPLRHYWWPYFEDITLSRWFDLVFFHQPWTNTGEYKISLWKKKDGFFSE